MREDIPRSVETGLAQMRREVPEFFVRDDDPDFVELYRQSYVEQLRFIAAGLERRPDLEERAAPAAAGEEARAAANLGIKLSSLLRVCRIGHRLMFEEALDKAQEAIVDEELRAEVLRATSRWLFDYFDWLTIRETEAYERERDLLVRDRERRRRQLVRAVLDGEPAELGYALDRDHLAVVVWGPDREPAVRALGEATGLDLLTVAGTSATAWAWLGAPRIGEPQLRAVRGFAPPAGTHLALGEPGRDADGFRLSHRQAWTAYRIARPAPEPVTWHADIALLALTLQDAELAREFVLRELGPLANGDERDRVLRDTLRAYFAAGQNAASAAAALGVHNRTVRYRLRSIEQRLGHPIAARREELAIAMRLRPVVLSD